VPLVEQRH